MEDQPTTNEPLEKLDELRDPHTLSPEVQMGVTFKGKEYWIPSIPYPMFVTTGLPFWKRWNEKNWRPQCVCGRIFDTMEDYEAHIIYKNTLWGRHDGTVTKQTEVSNAEAS